MGLMARRDSRKGLCSVDPGTGPGVPFCLGLRTALDAERPLEGLDFEGEYQASLQWREKLRQRFQGSQKEDQKCRLEPRVAIS